MLQSSRRSLFYFLGILFIVFFIGMVLYIVNPSSISQLAPFSPLSLINKSDAERIALRSLAGDASKQEQDKRFAAIFRLAKTARHIIIQNCKPDPLVYKTNVEEIKIQNKDATDHYISFDKSKSYIIRGRSETTVKLLFTQSSLMAFGYGCDGSQTSVGFVLIDKK